MNNGIFFPFFDIKGQEWEIFICSKEILIFSISKRDIFYRAHMIPIFFKECERYTMKFSHKNGRERIFLDQATAEKIESEINKYCELGD